MEDSVFSCVPVVIRRSTCVDLIKHAKHVFLQFYTPVLYLFLCCGLLKEEDTFNFSYEERERFMFAFLEADKSLRNKHGHYLQTFE